MLLGCALFPHNTGLLDLEEFVIAMALVDDVKGGQWLPETCPPAYVPPAKKHLL
jgi:hypothetical protein